MPLPPTFAARMRRQLATPPNDYDRFEHAIIATPSPLSIRLNRRKPATLAFESGDKVAWCAAGRYLPSRPIFALDPLWHGGAYYVQEASSMLLAECVRQWLLPTDDDRPLRVLDLCAAPGGKTTLLCDALPPDALVVANEVIRTRVAPLRENLYRWGYPHVVLANHDPADFAPLVGFFDLILVDAPCSGEGLFRKDPASIAEWSDEAPAHCAARQQRIVADIVPLLNPNGGVLIYSTCTYAPEENEANAARFADLYELTPLPLDLPDSFGVTATSIGYQCYPHRVRGEGFFVAGFRKTRRGEPLVATDTEEPSTHTRPYRKKDIETRANGNKGSKNLPMLGTATMLSAADGAKVEGYLNGSDFLYYQKPNGEVFALAAALLEAYTTLDAALTRKQLGLPVGELRKGVFTPSHALALSSVLHESTPRIAFDKATATLFLQKEVMPPPLDNAPTGWAVATYEGIALGWLKVLPNRYNNYLPNEHRLRMK